MSKIENEELYLDKKGITLDRVTAVDLDRLLELNEQTELNVTAIKMGIVRAFYDSDEFKRDVQPLFSNCDISDIERIVNLAKNKDIVLPHLADDLQAITGGEKITLNEFFEKKDKNGIAPYAAILIKRGGYTTTEALEKVISKKPDNLVMQIAKASRLLFDGNPEHDFTEERMIGIGKNGKKPYVTLQSYVAMSEHLLPATLTPYDGEVMNGICTLIENGQYCFTDSQVYEAFTGKSTKNKTSLEKVNKSIRKMRHTDIKLNWAAHAKQKGLDLPEDFTCVVGRYLLPADYYEFSLNGQVVQGYKLIQLPALYEYAKAVEQLQTINDRKLLDVGLSNTDDTVTLKNWFLRRIEGIKNPKSKMRNPILLDTVFEECNMQLDRTERSRKIKDIYTMLDAWTKQGYIKGYETRTGQKNRVEAIYIRL